ENVEDRHFALMLDVRVAGGRRLFIEGDGDEARPRQLGRVLGVGVAHDCDPLEAGRRIAAENRCASSPSARASAMAAGASAASAAALSFSNEVRFMKSRTPSPDENRAVREVGSTWLEPAM